METYKSYKIVDSGEFNGPWLEMPNHRVGFFVNITDGKPWIEHNTAWSMKWWTLDEVSAEDNKTTAQEERLSLLDALAKPELHAALYKRGEYLDIKAVLSLFLDGSIGESIMRLAQAKKEENA